MKNLRLAYKLFKINLILFLIILALVFILGNMAHAKPKLMDGKQLAEIKVMVIDTGIDESNPQLASHVVHPELPKEFQHLHVIPRNPETKPFFINLRDTKDELGHGTHVTGILLYGGFKQDHKPVSPVCPRIKIVPCKFYHPENSIYNLSSTVACLRLALALKVDYVNYSADGLQPSDKEQEALAALNQAGIPVYVAAGNDGRNISEEPTYPAGYKLDNMVAVGAIDKNGSRLPSSNYGPDLVYDLGKNVYSIGLNNELMYSTGTSMATPMVLHRILLDLCRYL